MAQAADPVGDHVEVSVALDHHEVQAVEKAQHKKGHQKADDKAQKGPIAANPNT
jgi:hypothetical protein